MSRNKLIAQLTSEGKTDDQIIDVLLVGTDTVKPVKGESDAMKKKFAKLILGKFRKGPKVKTVE